MENRSTSVRVYVYIVIMHADELFRFFFSLPTHTHTHIHSFALTGSIILFRIPAHSPGFVLCVLFWNFQPLEMLSALPEVRKMYIKPVHTHTHTRRQTVWYGFAVSFSRT